MVPAIITIALVVATSGAPTDVVTHDETDVLEIEPAPAAAGTYASVNGDTGEVEFILTDGNNNISGGGVNAEAVTDIGPVVIIRNVVQDRNATVWINATDETDGESVTFYGPDGSSMESEEAGIHLHPGDEVIVGMLVDTRGVEDTVLLDGATVWALLDEAPQEDEPDNGEDPGQGGGQGPPSSGGPPVDDPPPVDTPWDGMNLPPGLASDGPPEDTPAEPSPEPPTETTPGNDDDSQEVAAFENIWVIFLLLLLGAAYFAYRRLR